MTRATLETLHKNAIEVLTGNDLGEFTKPAPKLYPHQWNWDSAFIAIGLSHFDETRAQQEILSLLTGQWKSGLIPHIIFNPEASDYYPGPDFWQCERHPDAPRRIRTSCVTILK